MEKTDLRHSLGPRKKALAEEIQDVKEERAKEERSLRHSLGPRKKALADEIQDSCHEAKDFWQHCCPEAAVPHQQQCCPEAEKPDSRACFQEARIKDNRYDDYYLTFLHIFEIFRLWTFNSMQNYYFLILSLPSGA